MDYSRSPLLPPILILKLSRLRYNEIVSYWKIKIWIYFFLISLFNIQFFIIISTFIVLNIFRVYKFCGFSHENISCNFFPSFERNLFRKIGRRPLKIFLIKITTEQTSQKVFFETCNFFFFSKLQRLSISIHRSFFLFKTGI